MTATKVKERTWIGVAVIVFATLLIYIPAIRGGFIWDDPDYVVNNPVLRDAQGLVTIWTDPHSLKQWYPLVHTTYWIEYRLWGLNPLGYHVVNVLLHISVSLLLWRVLLKLEVPGAWLAAAIFALHPVHVESVAWITERKNVLSGVFYFASLLSYLKFDHAGADRSATRLSSSKSAPDVLRATKSGAERSTAPAWSAYVISLVLFIAALLSKSVTATLPAAILVIIWWKRGSIRWRDIWPLIPFFVIGIAMGLLTAYLEVEHVGATGQRIAEFNLSFVQRLMIAGGAVWFYLWKLIVPWPLVFIYPRWEIGEWTWQWVFPVAFIAVVIALALSRKRLGRAPLAALLLFVGTLFPALGFLNVYPMRFSFVADHFQYLASAPLIALGAALLSHLAPRMRGVIYGVSLSLLGILTWNQCHLYADAETLWRRTLTRNPYSWMVRVNLGDALFSRFERTGDRRAFDEAREHYLRSFQLAPNLWETNFPAGLALAGGDQQAQQQAMLHFQRTVELNPEHSRAWYCIGQLHEQWGQRDDAIKDYQKAIELQPGFVNARQRLEMLLRAPSTQAAN